MALRPAAGAAAESLTKTSLAARILATQRDVGKLYPNKLTALLRMGLPQDGIGTIEKSALHRHPKKLLRPLVEAYSKADLRGEALRVLHDQKPDAVSPYEPLLVECVKAGDDAGLRKAAWMMRDHGAVPTAETYGLLIAARLESGQPDRALRVAQHALSAGSAPPASAVDALIVALSEAGHTSSALSVAGTLRTEHGLCLDIDGAAMQTLLDGAARSPMPLEVLAVRQELVWHYEHADADATAAAATTIAPAVGVGSGARARSGAAARQGRRAEVPTSRPPLHDELLGRCVVEGNVPAAMALLRQLETEAVEPGALALDGLLQLLLDDDAVDEAARLAQRWFAGAHPLLGGQHSRAVSHGPVPVPVPVLAAATATGPALALAPLSGGGDGRYGLSGGGDGTHALSGGDGAGEVVAAWGELPSSGLTRVDARRGLRLELDLRGLPEGLARYCTMRFFQRVANTTPPEVLLDGGFDAHGLQQPWRGVTVLLSDASQGDAIARQAASLQPPIQLVPASDKRGGRPPEGKGEAHAGARADRQSPRRGRGRRRQQQDQEEEQQRLGDRGGHGGDATTAAMLSADREELARWARRCAEQRELRSNRSTFLMVAAGHNVLWTAALCVWMGWTMTTPPL